MQVEYELDEALINFGSCLERKAYGRAIDIIGRVRLAGPWAGTNAYSVRARCQGRSEYVVEASVANGGRILSTSCTCPDSRGRGYCKHVCGVLDQVVDRAAEMAARAARRQAAEEEARRVRRRMDRSSVYLVVSWKSEFDSGSDYRYSSRVKENYDQEIHGAFFTLRAANIAAREILREEKGDDDIVEDPDDDDDEPFEYSDEDQGDESEGMYHLEVQRKAVEDATAEFHP